MLYKFTITLISTFFAFLPYIGKINLKPDIENWSCLILLFYRIKITVAY